MATKPRPPRQYNPHLIGRTVILARAWEGLSPGAVLTITGCELGSDAHATDAPCFTLIDENGNIYSAVNVEGAFWDNTRGPSLFTLQPE